MTDKDYANVRERINANEEKFLSPYAQRSSQTRGRVREDKPCDFRTEFQRDRDRILHCKSFRLLIDGKHYMRHLPLAGYQRNMHR